MELADVPVILMLVGIAAYAVLAGADFGAPLWTMTARGETADRIREGGRRAMAPVWEANHVWLIFVLVLFWTAYPEIFGSVFSTLWIPLFLACVGIILRAVGYVAGYVMASRTFRILGIGSSFVTPFALGCVVGAIVSGRVPEGNAAGDILTAWTGPLSITIGLLFTAFCAYLAAVYLAADSVRAGDESLAEAFRRRGIAAGIVTGALALGAILVLRNEASALYQGLTEGAAAIAVIASGVAGILTLSLLVRGAATPARWCAAAAVVAVIAGWAIAQAPDIMPGVSVHEAAAEDEVLIALLVAVAAGAMILVPSLSLLYGLVLRGGFDHMVDGTGESGAIAAPRTHPEQSRTRTAVVLGAGGAGAVLSLVFNDGVWLYAGVVLLVGALFITAALLASALVAPDRPGPD
ncbi:MAG: cytochrome d ubiquinol oxidase subunit II [Actinomycetota bacterium]|nr:cytochrome d ubiquinol oxidase subunit II [Actinomycetota bacterium]